MKNLFTKFIFLLFCTCVTISISAQIKHGGTPLFYISNQLRSNSNQLFIDMPSFDIKKLQEEDKMNESNNLRYFRFAHKFYVNIERGIDGINTTLPDGTKLWQVGIRSKGAYSINVLFSEYHLPEGGKLFIYNSDKTHIIGSFTAENNSDNDMLPTQPVAGEEIIIEYQEPANAPFEARLKIAEVNHDYRGILAYPSDEPALDKSQFNCMLNALCADQNLYPDKNAVRSNVLLFVDGTTAFSGALINNSNNDGRPLLLTAVHCLNENFTINNPDYTKIAATAVCFFNYNRQVCSLTNMKGTEEMTTAGAIPVCIAVDNDMALLELKETPPDYYQPYYAGWNISSTVNTNKPFTNLHHPQAAVTKFGSCNSNLTLETLIIPATKTFNANSHWKVSSWNTGATDAGSSGSPLFDNNGLIIGGLSAGASECGKLFSDYFFALHKSWNYTPNVGNKLSSILNPSNLAITQWNGYDPYKENPISRVKNNAYNSTDQITNTQLSSGTGSVFGYNSIETTEFAEEFNTNKDAEVIGVYLFNPPFNLPSDKNIVVRVYKEGLSEENIVSEEIFRPQYLAYAYNSSAFQLKNKTTTSPSESYVKFSTENNVGKKFYISYKVEYPSSSNFSVYNTILSSGKSNSAWLKGKNGNWFPATEHPYNPMSTSLAIEPLVRLSSDTKLPKTIIKNGSDFFYDNNTKELTLLSTDSEVQGYLEIYDITGRFLMMSDYTVNNPIPLQTIGSNKVVLIKVFSKENSKIIKLIL